MSSHDLNQRARSVHLGHRVSTGRSRARCSTTRGCDPAPTAGPSPAAYCVVVAKNPTTHGLEVSTGRSQPRCSTTRGRVPARPHRVSSDRSQARCSTTRWSGPCPRSPGLDWPLAGSLLDHPVVGSLPQVTGSRLAARKLAARPPLGPVPAQGHRVSSGRSQARCSTTRGSGPRPRSPGLDWPLAGSLLDHQGVRSPSQVTGSRLAARRLAARPPGGPVPALGHRVSTGRSQARCSTTCGWVPALGHRVSSDRSQARCSTTSRSGPHPTAGPSQAAYSSSLPRTQPRTACYSAAASAVRRSCCCRW
ncbi:hypothetical protein ACVW00_000292 [Marmoricola sp. URHA0025 HA25]